MVKDPFFRNHLIRDGILRAIQYKMQHDSRVYILGEGAVMKVKFDAPEILAEFPDRVITMPISENSNTDFAVGMSIAGLVPIVDVVTADFAFRTMDAICNTAAKQATVGEPRTIVVRMENLTGGPTTGQRIEGLFARIPGLCVAVPSNPVDAYGLMLTALEHPGVTVFFEDRMIEDATTSLEEITCSSIQRVAFGKALLRQRGDILTVVSYGLMTRRLDSLLDGIDCDHLDLRTLWPLDMDAIRYSYGKTGRLLVVEPDIGFMGIGAEIIAQVSEKIGILRAYGQSGKVVRLGGPRVTISAARELHEKLLPSDKEILAAVRRMTE